MCTVQLPPGVNPIAINKYIISYQNYIWLASNYKIICLARVLLQFEASPLKDVYCAEGTRWNKHCVMRKLFHLLKADLLDISPSASRRSRDPPKQRGFFGFHVFKPTPRWFHRWQVATACFFCCSPDLISSKLNTLPYSQWH